MLKFRELISFSYLRHLIKLYHLKGTALVLIVFFSIFWQIGTLTSGLSGDELKQYNASSSIEKIVDNPVNAPFKLVEFGLIKVGIEKPLAARLTSALIASIFVAGTYIALQRLLGNFYANIGVLLLLGIPLFLILGRSGGSHIATLALFPFLFMIRELTRRMSNPGHLKLIIVALLLVLSIYVPGSAWFLLPIAVIYRREILKSIKLIKRSRLSAYLILLLVLITPLLFSVFSDSTHLREWLLLPEQFPGVKEALMRAIWFVPSLLFTARDASFFNVGHEPILNIAMLALVALGIAASTIQDRSLLAKFSAVVLIGWVFYILNGQTQYLIVLTPVLIILAVTGLMFLYKEWRRVFPNNPIPKNFAVSLILALCMLQAFYGYHIAHNVWPKTDLVKSSTVVK